MWCSCIGRDTTVKLGRKVEDLEDVRYLVNILNEVRGCIGYSDIIGCMPACLRRGEGACLGKMRSLHAVMV